MRRIREVLRLKYQCELSYGEIARVLKLAKGTIANYLSAAAAAGIDHEAASALDDAALATRLYGESERRSRRSRFIEPDFTSVHQELKRKGVTLTLLWEEYCQRAPAPGCGGDKHYSHSRFCERYVLFARSLRRSMRQTHLAGEKLFVDFAGPTVPIIDQHSGEVRAAHIFVAVWGASNFTYAEARSAQTSAEWIAAHVNAFAYFGGVPTLLVPDNARALISEANRYEPQPNRSYEAFAEHYGCAILPARPYKPRDKAKVEAAVLLVERWILARLRHRRFFSLIELNVEIRTLLDALNDRPLQKLPGTRRSCFEQIERPVLRALPASAFEYAEFKYATVSRLDYHIEFERHFYSVPHQLVGQRVELRITATSIEILHRHRRVAAHARAQRVGAYSTVPEHMPASHRAHANWSPQRLIAWGKRIGPNTEAIVTHILQSKPHPEQGYRACLGMLALARQYGDKRLEAACRRAVHLNTPTRKSVASMLSTGLDKAPLPRAPFEHAAEPHSTHHSVAEHDNVRGPKYYH